MILKKTKKKQNLTLNLLSLWCNSVLYSRFPHCLPLHTIHSALCIWQTHWHKAKAKACYNMTKHYENLNTQPHKMNIPTLARAWLAWSLRIWVRRARWTSIVSCMAFTRTRRFWFSICSMEFSWYMSLMLSRPSSPTMRLPCTHGQTQHSTFLTGQCRLGLLLSL